jgi:hypothetical protein
MNSHTCCTRETHSDRRRIKHLSIRHREAPRHLHKGHRTYFPGINQPGRSADHRAHFLSTADVKQRVESYFHSLSAPSWDVKGEIQLFNLLSTSKMDRPILKDCILYFLIIRAWEQIYPFFPPSARTIDQTISNCSIQAANFFLHINLTRTSVHSVSVNMRRFFPLKGQNTELLHGAEHKRKPLFDVPNEFAHKEMTIATTVYCHGKSHRHCARLLILTETKWSSLWRCHRFEVTELSS